MTTVAKLIDKCASALRSYTGTQELVTYLTAAVDADDTTIPVASANRVQRGIVEVGDELMRVYEVSDSNLVILPDGRGEAGSTAASHATNSRVTTDPVVPRVRIFEALQDALRQVQPHLFAVKSTTLTYTTGITTYELPADTDRVLRVQIQDIGPSQEWLPVRTWRMDESAQGLASGRALVLGELLHPGRTVQVVYAAPLTVPTSTSTDMETAGISASIQDLLFYNVMWRTVQILDSSRLQLQAVEQQSRFENVRPGDAMRIAEGFRQTFMIRLAEERKRLLDLFPPTMHYAR